MNALGARRLTAVANLVRALAPALALAGGALAGPPPALAAEDWLHQTEITGTVVDADGRPVRDIDVLLVELGDSTSREGTGQSDARGRFELTPRAEKDASARFTLAFRDSSWQTFRTTYLGGGHSLAAAKTLRLGEAQIDAGATTVTWAAKARTSRSAIDTRSRAAVAKAYRQRLRPALRSAPVRKPSGCRAPATPKAEQKRAVKAINFYRAMAGLDPVKLKASLSRRATQAALIQYHAGFLSHFPPASAKCWTKTGAAASANSNLLLRGSSIPLKSWPEGAGGSARGYMIDSGPHNESVGHRWWLLEPQLAAVGIGNVGLANATYVGAKLKATRATPPWIAWPSAGYFPKQEEPEGRWSFQSPRPDTSFAKAKVKVTTASGRRLPVRKLDATPAGPIAGWHAIVWKVGRLPKVAGRKARLVTVTVSGIVQRGERLAPQRYQVKLFDPSK